MRIAGDPESGLAELARYDAVLAELVRVGKPQVAEELAWAATEELSARHTPAQVLPLASQFLLALSESVELRKQVATLYRAAYADREGLEELLKAAGLEEGRPVRRALRTLDVCLATREGTFLVARDEDGAARVDRIDLPAWRFTLNTGGDTRVLDPVNLADHYAPAPREHLTVMRRFFVEELAQQVRDDPAGTIIRLCQQHGNVIDSDRLEAILVPVVLDEEAWKKWFSNARSALRRVAHVRIEGRAPWVMRFLETATDPAAEFQQRFAAAHTPRAHMTELENYLRECRQKQVEASPAALEHACHWFVTHARKHAQQQRGDAALYWLLTRRAAELCGAEELLREVREWAAGLPDIRAVLDHIDDDDSACTLCVTVAEARPATYRDDLRALLPLLPPDACEVAAGKLMEPGMTADWGPITQEVLANPTAHFGALLWLWNQPSDAPMRADLPALTLLTRVLGALEQAQRLEQVDREQAKLLGARARAVLGSRGRQRFRECLTGIDVGMARTLRIRLNRLDLLGRAVREDLLRDISHHFPDLIVRHKVHPWKREDVLYTTRTGLTRRRAELDDLVNVKMRANAKAIGEAAEKGDLSENSEYKFALEERDLLRARLAQMNSELDIAKTLTADEVPTDHVGIGTRVLLEHTAGGPPLSLCFLGPWDTDAAHGIYHYQTPLAERFLGRHVGDEVELDQTGMAGVYRIAALQNELLPPS